MEIFALCGCAVISCVLITTVKQQRADIAVLLSIAAGVILFAFILSDLKDTVDAICDMFVSLGDYMAETLAVVKALGICLVAQLASDVCRDAGQASVAAKVELGGRIAALSLILPLLSAVLDISSQVING